jgi:Zn-finger nucleic acid-binding protein
LLWGIGIPWCNWASPFAHRAFHIDTCMRCGGVPGENGGMRTIVFCTSVGGCAAFVGPSLWRSKPLEVQAFEGPSFAGQAFDGPSL